MELTRLCQESETLGAPAWRPMLRYVADLHAKSVRPAEGPFPHPWEEIGPGYCYGPGFGHWDLVHQVMDVMPSEPDHGLTQLRNFLAQQDSDGMFPGVVYKRENGFTSGKFTHPPVWPVAVEEYVRVTGDLEFIRECLPALERQIAWFEAARSSVEGGFYYLDILEGIWESGVDEGIRFLETLSGKYTCVDATAHMYLLYATAASWAGTAGAARSSEWVDKAERLRAIIQDRLFDAETGFFHDIWAVGNPRMRRLSYEGIWPVVVGAATAEQAARVIDENLLNPERFFTPHPISTVSKSDRDFELRMWRGPAWNSMTYWAARGCARYGRDDAAALLLKASLDDSARQFALTGTIWEFYHPFGGDQNEVHRKPDTKFDTPCRDYLGHNPLIAMARLCEESAARRNP